MDGQICENGTMVPIFPEPNHITASTGFALEIILMMHIISFTSLIMVTKATVAIIISLMSFEMEGEVIRPAEASITVCALEWFCSCVLSIVASQFV